jgi:hypothetical protein
MTLLMGVSLLLGVGEVFPSLTFWSCGICFCDAKKFRIHSIVYVQTLDCWCFGSSKAFIQCLEWWTWWKRLLVPQVQNIQLQHTEPILHCVCEERVRHVSGKRIAGVFTSPLNFFFQDCGKRKEFFGEY